MGRDARRIATLWLHWLSFAGILWFVSVPFEWKPPAAPLPHVIAALLVAGVAAIWFALYALHGPLFKPGPKLERLARRVHRPAHHALYLSLPLLAGAAVVTPLAGIGEVPGWAVTAQDLVVKVMLFAVILHAIYHLWRHTALNDGALRKITPRAIHHLL